MAITTLSDGNLATVKAAVAAATEGDTLVIPAGSVWNWGGPLATGALTINKGLTLKGGGNAPGTAGATTIALTGPNIQNGAIQVLSGHLKPVRITNIYFQAGGGTGQGMMEMDTVPGNPIWRIDHCFFDGLGNAPTMLNFWNGGYGLVDHCTFTAGPSAEMVKDNAYGASGNQAGWQNTVVPGSFQFVYLEDCTFIGTGSTTIYNTGCGSTYGSQNVIRHCAFKYSKLDRHGNSGNLVTGTGSRWWEIYNNTFDNLGGSQDHFMDLRDGSGVIFNNSTPNPNILNSQSCEMRDDTVSSTRVQWQIGQGVGSINSGSVQQPPNNSPVYIWGNGPVLNTKFYGGTPSVVSGSDFILFSTNNGAAPPNPMKIRQTAGSGATTYNYPYNSSTGVAGFTYPYPLDANGMPNPAGGAPDITPPTIPTGLAVGPTTSSSLTLTWNESTDADNASSTLTYTITRSRGGGPFNQIATGVPDTSGGNTYVDTFSILSGTTYEYEVSAQDPAGNSSAACPFASGTTTASSFLNPATTVDWTLTGISGGIPSANWPIAATLNPIGGGVDDSVSIQAALDSAHTSFPNGAVVVLNPGVYTLHRASIVASNRTDDFAGGVYECGLIIDKNNLVLRGSGPNHTTLNYGDGANILSLGTTYQTGSQRQAAVVNITSTANKGATQITLASMPAAVTPGSILVVSQTNPIDSDGNPLVDTTGYAGGSSSGHVFPTHAMTQLNRVTAVNGLVVTLETPLYFTYNNVPCIYPLPNIVRNSGYENLKVVATATTIAPQNYKNINLESCYGCWVLGCESDFCLDRSHIYLSDCYRCNIQNNYAYWSLAVTLIEGTVRNGSGENYAIFLEFCNSACLMENNIIRLARHSQPMNGGSGNVWAFNYDVNPYLGESPSDTLPDRGNHGAHPYMNLWEGNDMPNLEMDFTHGSSSHNTFFRNYISGVDLNPNTGVQMTTGNWLMNIAYQNNYCNVAGNAFGPYLSPGALTVAAYQLNGVTDDAGHSSTYKLGYWDDGGTATPNATLSNKVEGTITRGGNWDIVTGVEVWNNNVPAGSLVSSYLAPQTMPQSLYRGSAPTFFVSTNTPFPPVDPASATIVNKIPARKAYESLGIATGGAFDPTFYSTISGSPTPPIPSSNPKVFNP